MNQRELEQLEKKSIYSLRINGDLKDSVISGYLNELNKVVKKEKIKKKIIVSVIRLD